MEFTGIFHQLFTEQSASVGKLLCQALTNTIVPLSPIVNRDPKLCQGSMQTGTIEHRLNEINHKINALKEKKGGF